MQIINENTIKHQGAEHIFVPYKNLVKSVPENPCQYCSLSSKECPNILICNHKNRSDNFDGIFIRKKG